MRTTVGQVLINEALPPDQRDYGRVWDKANMRDTLAKVARKHPDKYARVTRDLMRVGESAAMASNYSFSLDDFESPKLKVHRIRSLRENVQRIMDNPALSNKQKDDAVTKLLGGEVPKLVKETLESARKSGSRLAEVVASGAKGNPAQFNTTVGAPLMYTGPDDKPVPIPVFHSIAEGLDPAEYWAGSYGARKGVVSTKFSTREAGFFGKKLALAAQRGVVTEEDCGTQNGVVMHGDDPENVGTVLQVATAGIPAGTVIKPEHLKKLRGKEVVVRSPLACQAGQGTCSRCSGIRENGQFPSVGDNIGLDASMSLGEKLSQMMLNTKHGAGAADATREYGYADVENLFEMPQHNTMSAAVATKDGRVETVQEAPQGGYYVRIGGVDHWTAAKEDIKVKPGSMVEAGDVLSKGIPNPKEIAAFRGIGDARKEFMNSLRETAGNAISRRNAEIMARSMISHVKVEKPNVKAGVNVGDIVRYDDLVKDYKARPNSKMRPLSAAKGQYLEQPVLHYSIGTRVNNRMAKALKQRGVQSILTNEEEPGFKPDVQRLYDHSQVDPDWMARMAGYKLKGTLLQGVHAGDVSEEHSTSYVPSLAKGVEFGDPLKEQGKY
jgi:DNA-directed RNA polymerase subunit beta'